MKIKTTLSNDAKILGIIKNTTNLGCNTALLYVISYYVILYISSNQTIRVWIGDGNVIALHRNIWLLCNSMVHVSLYGRILLEVQKRKNEYICRVETS
mgnify:CR=1 FL=1